MLIAGIDEAGKGSVIGPLVVCGTISSKISITSLSDVFVIDIKDSKKLNKNKREKIYNILKEKIKFTILKIEPWELDKLMEKETINDILAKCYAEIINRLRPEIAYVDSPDVKPQRLKERLERETGIRVIAMHNAERIPIVAAASIIAKVERDREIEKLKNEYGDFGSGYPSDRKTIKFIQDCVKRDFLPKIIRKKWKTVSNSLQTKLGD